MPINELIEVSMKSGAGKAVLSLIRARLGGLLQPNKQDKPNK
jgi:hypothetical protein